MRIDAHQHFWRYTPADYGWIGDAMQALRRDFLPEDLEPELMRAGLEGCVAVQARQSLAETRFLLELSAGLPWIAAVVGWADLCAPDAERTLETLRAHPRLAGLRHVVQDEPDDRFLLRADFQRGVALLRRFGLTYDLLVYPRQLPAVLELVAAFPEQPFVVDHLAKPAVRAGQVEPWRTHIRALARFPNVSCKISGLLTEARWKEWKRADFGPYLATAVEAFGEDRLMFGSDWPVCLLSGSYQDAIALAADAAARLARSTGHKLFGLNAARFYGIPRR